MASLLSLLTLALVPLSDSNSGFNLPLLSHTFFPLIFTAVLWGWCCSCPILQTGRQKRMRELQRWGLPLSVAARRLLGLTPPELLALSLEGV